MTASPAFASAVGWSYAMDGGRQIITSVMGLILAALLGPEAFGIVTMALVFVLFIELLLKQGMPAAIVQRRDLGDRHLDSAFWLVMGCAALLTVVSVLLSGWWAAVNRTPQLGAVIVGLTPMIPLQGTVVVQEALLRRELRFRPLAVRNTVSALLGGGLGIGLALAGFGVWALVVQQVSTVLIAAVALWAVSDWRPRLRFHPREARELLGFSSGSFLGSLGVFVNNRADALLIGLLFGPVVVGLYRMATRLVDMVIGITVRALQSVALPDLSAVQDDPDRFRQRVLRLFGLSALMSVPVLGVLGGSAEAVLRLLGEEWAPSVNALRLLCVAALAHGLFAFIGPMLQALGRPHQQALLSWTTAALSAGGFLAAALLVRSGTLELQLTGLALSRTVLYCGVLATIAIHLVLRLSHVRPGELVKAAAPSGLAALGGAGVAALAWEVADGAGLAVWLAAAVTAALSAAVAAAVVVGLDERVRGVLNGFVAAVSPRRPMAAAVQGHATSLTGHEPTTAEAPSEPSRPPTTVGRRAHRDTKHPDEE